MAQDFFGAMRDHGFSNNTTASVRKQFVCPKCGFQFSLVYARSFACQGCSEAVRGCPKVRCNRCDCEFPIESSGDVHGRIQEHTLAQHMNGIMNRRSSERGYYSDNR